MKPVFAFIIVTLLVTNSNVYSQQTQFGNITATLQSNCVVKINFSTITEYATDLMRIQRSKDGINFIEIGTLIGHQTANGLAGSGFSYTYNDNNPFTAGTSSNGIYYYRVRTNKFDETYGPYIFSPSANLSVISGPGCPAASNALCTPGALGLSYTGFGFTPGTLPVTACQTPPTPIQVMGIAPQTITWNSSNQSVATINANGFFTPVAAGTTNVYAYLPACNITMPTNTFTVCPCNGNQVPYGLGGNWGLGACQLYFSRIANITTYKLEWVNYLTGIGGSKTIVYTGATYAFTDLPYGTPFKYRVAATVGSACTTTDFSPWVNIVQSNNCSPYVPSNLVASCVCGATCAGSCGYERFNWTAVPNSFTYKVEYEVYRVSPAASLPVQTFQISQVPPTVQQIANYSTLTGGGWLIRFRVSALCIDGNWGAFSPWSASFNL